MTLSVKAAVYASAPQHFLYFFPLPQGQGLPSRHPGLRRTPDGATSAISLQHEGEFRNRKLARAGCHPLGPTEGVRLVKFALPRA